MSVKRLIIKPYEVEAVKVIQDEWGYVALQSMPQWVVDAVKSGVVKSVQVRGTYTHFIVVNPGDPTGYTANPGEYVVRYPDGKIRAASDEYLNEHFEEITNA